MIKDSKAWQHRGAWLIIILGGFGLRLYRLGAGSLWYDETVSAYLASKSIPHLIAHTANDIHPPGYYLLLHLWVRLASDSEFALAFFSLVFGMLLIPLSYALAHRLYLSSDKGPGRTAALWSALLVATSPYNLWYSQEVRMYTLGAALGLVTLWCGLKMADIKSANRQIGKAAKRQSGKAAKRQSGKLANQQSGKAAKRQSGKAAKRQSGKAAKQQSGKAANWHWLVGYVMAAAMGLYVLYYFGFLLVTLNLFVIGYLAMNRRLVTLRTWLLAQVAALVLYLPWLPIAWRQATNPPVPPWRGLIPLHTVALEAWTALSLGQSVQPGQVWPILLIVGALFLLGFKSQISKSAKQQISKAAKRQSGKSPIPNTQYPTSNIHLLILFATYVFGPLALIYLVSLITPLYHVRYLFTYSPPFYILLGSGLAWLTRRAQPSWPAWRSHVGLAVVAALALLVGSAFSIRELHTNPRYAADDFRAAVGFIAERWRPGDVILVNAGYAYTGFVYYYDGPVAGPVRLTDDLAAQPLNHPLLLSTGVIGGDPDLGWGNPNSDFYATTQAETAAALTRVTQTFPRLWVLRIYDTVTDPAGFIRGWLAANTVPFEDQAFTGESFMHVQGFMSRNQPTPPPGNDEVALAGGITLLGWQVGPDTRAGAPLDVVLWWQADAPPATNYAVSLKLWGPEDNMKLAAQQDEWPVGSLLFTSAWRPGRAFRHPMRLWLPAGLPPGQYRLNVEMYDPATVQPLPRHDGQGHTIPLGSVTVTPNQ